MSRKISLILIVLFLIVSGGLFAQNAQELRFGSVVSGNLRSGEEIWYSIRVTETCFLLIETTGNTDTYLELYDAQRNLLMEDDDGSGNENNAKIETLALRGTNYLVKLRAYGSEYGPFRIMASYTPLSDAVELRLGSILSGNLSSGQKQLYSIRTTQAGLYTVETTGDLDTYLEAYDSSFSFIDSDDDGGYDYNARIDIFAEANKVYYLVLRGYGSSESGPYRISASFEAVNAGSANNTSRSTAITLSLGEGVPVFFTSSGQTRWFVYQTNRAVTFVVQTRGNMDTVLGLYDSRGDYINSDDDSGDDYNAFISTRLDAGTYYIEVGTYGGGTGRCTLHAEIR